MATKLLRFASLLLLIVALLNNYATFTESVSGPHLADVNILLPPKMTHPVEYRLQGSDGCFQWSWDHHDILSVLPEYNVSSRCSTSARLRSIAFYGGRKETAVYAADVQTGIVVRCKVFIDNFSRIQIFHNSIKLDLDGLATLRVRAFDNEDNVFSSLVGLRFRWQLTPQIDGSPNHLVHVPLKESPLSDCGGLCGDLDIQIKLEENSGIFSDLYVVKGIGIGLESVTVHVLEEKFENMADKIVLTVAEAMSIYPPSPVFVLIGAAVHYKLKVIRANVPQEITLPSPYHEWSVSNSSVAEVNSATGLTNALNLGVAIITVEDTRVAGHFQMSSLNVVLPDDLLLYILPLSVSGYPVEGVEAIPSVARWYIVSGRQYLIYMKVFAQGPGLNEIYVTESDDIKWQYDQSEHWKTSSVLDNIALKDGWWNSRLLKATSHGLGKLTASLTYTSGHSEAKEVLKALQEVMVCKQVKLGTDERISVSQKIMLPWAPAVFQEMELKATGGCAKTSSDYKWFSSDRNTLSVSAFGVVQAKKPGNATVTVASIFDPLNYDEAVIEVSVPSSLVMLQNFPVETVVGSHLHAAVTMKASNGAYFHECDAFNSLIRWKTGSESFIVVNATGEIEIDSSVIGTPCAWTSIYASGSGRTLLHATFAGPNVLKASSHIGAYLPLIVHQAGDGNQFGGYWFNLEHAEEARNQLEHLDDLYLIPGTHLDLMLSGGPEKWDQGADFIETVEIVDDEQYTNTKDGVSVHRVYLSNRSMYRVLCGTLGTFVLVFKRGNLVGGEHYLPALAVVKLTLECTFPSSIAVIADEPVNAPDVVRTVAQAEYSPGRIRTTPITVANGRTIRVAAVGISNSGNAFANSSSLNLRWELNSCDKMAYWDDAYELKASKSSWEKFLVLKNASGLCIVRATVTGFIDSVVGLRFDRWVQSFANVLTDAIRLRLVSTLRVDPEYKLLFSNPEAKTNLSITGGSCFLDALTNDSRIVEVIQSPPGLQCLQLTLAARGLGTALITVYDVGLTPPLAASSVVRVADVDWIKINSQEEISLMDGSSLSIDLLAGVSDGSTFDSSQYVYMDIHVHIEDNIIDLKDIDGFPSPRGGHVNVPHFTIQAKHLGFTTIYVTARRQSGDEVVSQPIKVEVYAPPEIYPHDIFLVPGASYVLTVKGGPTRGVSVEYDSMDNETATVDKSSGRLTAISPGNTTLLAMVYGNGDVMICQARGSVKVGIPSSMTLTVQSDQLAIGREMSIFPSSPEGNLFSFYELCKNYKWTIEDDKVLDFRAAKHLHNEKSETHIVGFKEINFTSYLDEKEHGFISVLYGRSAGKTNVGVTFDCDFVSSTFSQSRSYDASVMLWVVPDLPLALGVPMTWVLPPHYTTSKLLPSSLESHSNKGTITYSLLSSCRARNEEMQQDSISIDGERIRTTHSKNLACIQAKDRTTGRSEIASCVRVAEVAQIRVTTKESPLHAIDLAVGAELELPVNYRDVLGNPFYEAYNVILFSAETNYPDIVSINDTHDSNGNIHLKAMRHGRALLRVSINSSPSKSDYIVVSVGAHLYPSNPVLQLGSYVNFRVEGLNEQESGQWLTSNRSVAKVDKLLGKVEAVGEGSAQVIFKGSNLKLQTVVTVLNAKYVLIDAPLETLTNAPFPTKGYNFTVKFSTREAPDDRRDILHDCMVDPPFVGYTKPWRDLDTGISYCLFFPYTPEHLVHSVPKSKDMRPDISVSITSSLREVNHVSGAASALFIGGFSILDKNLLQLNLSPESDKSFITIIGNTDVEIHWHDRDVLMVSPIYKEDFGIGGRAKFEVKVLKPKKFQDKIIITLPANGQREELEVSYEPGKPESPATNFNTTIWASIVGCFAVLLFTVAIFVCFLDRPQTSRASPPTASLTPSTTAPPITPIRGAPSIMHEDSPRTPPEFVEYLRRTIDETPHYRKDSRKRFNVQNTF